VGHVLGARQTSARATGGRNHGRDGLTYLTPRRGAVDLERDGLSVDSATLRVPKKWVTDPARKPERFPHHRGLEQSRGGATGVGSAGALGTWTVGTDDQRVF